MSRLCLAVLVIHFLLSAETLRLDRKGDLTRAVFDSPEVRSLISANGADPEVEDLFKFLVQLPRDEMVARSREIHRDPDKYLPRRKHFLDAMASAPSIILPGKTRAKVIEISKAKCSADFRGTITYIRVRIEDKKQSVNGSEVWICRNPYSLPYERP